MTYSSVWKAIAIAALGFVVGAGKLSASPDDRSWWPYFDPPPPPPTPGGHGMSFPPSGTAAVFALAKWDGKVVAGGNFRKAGTTQANWIASWEDGWWRALPYGSGMNGTVSAVTVFMDTLIATGVFTAAGGVPARHIASWDGNSWHELGHGIGTGQWDCGWAFAVYPNLYRMCLVVGGNFGEAGGKPFNRIACWNGTSWDSLGSGMNGDVWALTVFRDTLIAGGDFTTAGGRPANHIAAWHWSTRQWRPLGSGMNSSVEALTNYQNIELVAGGDFTQAGGVLASAVASWDGAGWHSLDCGVSQSSYPGYPAEVRALTVYNGDVIAGGDFLVAGCARVPASNIARFRWGSGWSALGSGVNSWVSALLARECVRDPHSRPSPCGLIVGGTFTQAGNKPSYAIASWEDSIVATATPEALQPRTALYLGFNSPNPFNPGTTLAYFVPTAGRVRLTLHDVRGGLIATLVDRLQPAGNYSVYWNGVDASGAKAGSGVYVARLASGSEVRSRKIVLAE